MIEQLILYFPIVILLFMAIMLHEMGHLFSSILCGVKVKIFSIGIGKPFIKYKFRDTLYQITPWLLGGYTDILGERQYIKKGFLSAPYIHKVIILSSGVIINFLIALICFQIYYGNALHGLFINLQFISSIFVKNSININQLFNLSQNFNIFLFGSINLLCVIFNLLPIPSTDGSLLIIYKIPHKIKMSILKTFTQKWFRFVIVIFQLLLLGLINL